MEIPALLSKLSDTMYVSRSFGPAAEHDGVTVIPVGLVVGGGGLGTGTESEESSGSGGGFGTVSWPLGVYTVSQGQVRFVPALDVTRLAIAAIGGLKLVAKLRARRRTG